MYITYERGYKNIQIELNKSDLEKFSCLIRLLKNCSKLDSLGKYRRMKKDDIWKILVKQVCVMGSSKGLSNLKRTPNRREDFNSAISLLKIISHKKRELYLEKIFREFKVTRFPNKSAKKLVDLLKQDSVVKNGRLTLLNHLSHAKDPVTIRNTLIERCNGLLNFKSISDFMISVGLSHDVIALDTRIVGNLKKHFGFNLKTSQIQNNKKVYLSIENSLRPVCKANKASLALLDRVLYNFSSKPFIDTIFEFPELAGKLL